MVCKCGQTTILPQYSLSAGYKHELWKIQFQQGREVSQMSMSLDDIYNWIISHPTNYAGKHLDPQPRVDSSHKPLEPKAQLAIIFKATCEYIRELMENGKGVNFRNFGAFTCEVFSEHVKPAQLSNFDITKELEDQRLQRKHIHEIRPCFVPDKKFQSTLLRYPGKEELQKPKSQHSIYQKGFSMIFCNPTPIAQACSVSRETVSAAHDAFAKALCDLVDLGKSFEIRFPNFITIRVVNRDLTYKFSDDFVKRLNQTNYEQKMKKANTKTSDHWGSSYDEKWNKSTLGSLLNKPNSEEVKNYYEKGLALKIMSLDLNTTEKTTYVKPEK